MSILKFVSPTPRSPEDMYAYITHDSKTIPEYTFGINVSSINTIDEINHCRQEFPKEKQAHIYQQAIFAFDKNLIISNIMAKIICIEIGKILAEDTYQVVGALHFDSPSKLHCHYMIHNTSIHGKSRGHGADIYRHRHKINHILTRYGLNPIGRKTN